MNDPHNLQRFVEAQGKVYPAVVAELRSGRKTSHWMWFVFPQISGLGRSSTAQVYAIADLAEARAYLAHTVLGARLVECTQMVLGVEGRSAHEIFGTPDDLKFHSSMTLFREAAGTHAPFHAALQKYFGGAADAATLTRLAAL